MTEWREGKGRRNSCWSLSRPREFQIPEDPVWTAGSLRGGESNDSNGLGTGFRETCARQFGKKAARYPEAISVVKRDAFVRTTKSTES